MFITVRAAFEEFASRLEPTETQKKDAATKQIGVRDCLNAKLWVETAFLTGSYARQTMIRPPSDIDLFVVLDYSKHGQDYYHGYNGEQNALERFHNILKECYPYTGLSPPSAIAAHIYRRRERYDSDITRSTEPINGHVEDHDVGVLVTRGCAKLRLARIPNS